MQDPYNVSLYPGTGSADGQRGDHIILAPAYTVTEDDIRLIVSVTARVVKHYFRKYDDLLLKQNGEGIVDNGFLVRLKN